MKAAIGNQPLLSVFWLPGRARHWPPFHFARLPAIGNQAQAARGNQSSLGLKNCHTVCSLPLSENM